MSETTTGQTNEREVPSLRGAGRGSARIRRRVIAHRKYEAQVGRIRRGEFIPLALHVFIFSLGVSRVGRFLFWGRSSRIGH